MNGPKRAVFSVILLIIGTGCARQDWIDRTLVTESVAGVWEGSAATSSGQPSIRDDIRLELEQEGPTVTGFYRGRVGEGRRGTAPIEGSMAGDVFTFRDVRGTLTGELTVGGDEMTGQGVIGTNRAVTFRLRRINSAPSPPR